ncbi:MAG: type 4a pilus biogenesis protein PilO [Candidatus Latescibacterota bacterium]
MAIDFDIKDPKNQRMLATVIIAAALIYAFFNFVIKVKGQELKIKKAEVVTLTQNLSDMERGLQTKVILLAERESLQKKLKELETNLPEHENVAALLDQLSRVENNAKVYVVGFKADETVEGGGKLYQANKYKITIEAGFHQFAEFMSGIMALPRILSFSDMKISANPAAKEKAAANIGLEDQPRSLTIECTVTSYIFKNLGESEAGAKEKKQ